MSNKWANLKYTIPAGFDDITAEENKNVDGVNEAYGVYISGDEDSGAIIDFEKKGYDPDVPNNAKTYLEETITSWKNNSDMAVSASEISQMNIGGINYWVVSLVSQDSYETLYLNVAIADHDGYYIKMTFGSESLEYLSRLTAGLGALS